MSKSDAESAHEDLFGGASDLSDSDAREESPTAYSNKRNDDSDTNEVVQSTRKRIDESSDEGEAFAIKKALMSDSEASVGKKSRNIRKRSSSGSQSPSDASEKSEAYEKSEKLIGDVSEYVFFST